MDEELKNESEFVPEDDPEMIGVDPAQKVKKLKEKLDRALAEKQEYLDMSQRLRADYLNLQKNQAEATGQIVKLANEKLIKDLLSTLESFDLAFANKAAWEAVDATWRAGVENIYQRLLASLQKHGVAVLDPLKQVFNPEEQQSVGVVETALDTDDNMVLEVVQKGYALNGKVIKPALVKIGHKI
jgi:molecular chaperone GrpE